MSRPKRHEIRRWQILIAAAGTLGETELFGRCIIADGRLVGKYVGPHAMTLTFEEEGGEINLFCYAFLCSRIGIRALRSASYGTKILGIRKDILADLPIPLPGSTTQARVAALVREAVEARERYAEELRAARAVVEALPEMQEALEMCRERRGRSVLWDGKLPTLSAWTYASTGGALGYLKRKWTSRLGDAVSASDLYYGLRFARIDCRPPYGIELLSQRDIFLMRPIPRRIVHPGLDDRYLFARKGTLLLGAQGTLGEGEIFGRVALVDDHLAKKAFTQHLLRVRPADEYAASVYAFLSTLVGLRLLRSTAVGTKLLSLRFDIFRRLPFPALDAEDLRKVHSHVEVAMILKARSLHLETEAIRIVEEEVLPEWLA